MIICSISKAGLFEPEKCEAYRRRYSSLAERPAVEKSSDWVEKVGKLMLRAGKAGLTCG
jgi:hypothetical protein